MTFARPTPESRAAQRAAERDARAAALVAGARGMHRGTYGGQGAQQLAQPAPQPRLRRKDKVRQDIRDSARGEECTVRIPGVCTHDPEKTIWSHAPWGAAGKGRGTKALDLCGAFACTACDAAIDRQATLPPGLTREAVELAWMHGHLRSLVRLAEKGLL